MSASHEFHSPLTLLRQWRDRTDGAPLREVLVTGYTHDLVFLERHFVPTARGLGARVTVIGDASQVVHTAVDVRHAGRSYLYGHASCGGAFHPKLVVLLGDEDVWIAIGSGNPTMSGWGHNYELWLVLRSTRRRGPVAQRELAEWLTDLPRVVAMPSWIADTVTAIGETIDPASLTDDTAGWPADLRIFGNLRRSLLGQLPTDDAHPSLRLTAPFFDAQAAAVRALIKRLQPDEVHLAIQPTLSQYDGRTLIDATATVPTVRFRFLAEDRTYHGKLVEWDTSTGTTVALTGSANLSAAAMLTATVNGGNCELVTACPVSASLLPDGGRADHTEVGSVNTIPPADNRKPIAPTLLGARRLANAIVVELRTSTREPVTIETSPDGTPGTWMPAHVLTLTSTETITAQFQIPEQVGGAVRAVTIVNGEHIASSEVFLTDTSRCLPRDDEPDRPKLTRDYDLNEVFTDPQLASRFNADLLRLLGHTHQRAASAPLGAARTAPGASAADEDRWGSWVSEVERTLGPTLTGLVFPGALQLPVDGP